MKKILGCLSSLLLIAMLSVPLVFLSSCAKTEQIKDDSFICTKEAFEAMSKDIINKDRYTESNVSGDMISSEALAKDEKKLIRGEKYYFVLVYYSNVSKTSVYNFDFAMCDTEGVYYNEEAVLIHSIWQDTAYVSNQTEWGIYEITDVGLAIVALEFTPKHTGTVRINATVGDKSAMAESENNWDFRVDDTASVLERKYYVENSSEATVSNLRCKKSVTEDGYIFSVNFDMDITKASDEKTELYCAIYMHSGTEVNGPWDNLTIDMADTGNYKYGKSEYGKVIFFSYSAGAVEKKNAEILLEFDDMEDMDIDVFVTGDGLCVDGTVYDSYVANYD